jgi:hypothetical protein
MQKKIAIVTYESLIHAFDSVMLQLSDTFDLDPVSEDLEFTNCDKTFTPAAEDIEVDENEFVRRQYYEERHYLQYYSLDLIRFVNNQLDKHLMSGLGYAFEKSEV